MRFLACGGAGRAERARIGEWPEIGSGLLLDVRGLTAGVPAFGLGLLQGRPFVIHRELLSDGGQPVAYSFLLEPSPEQFDRFRWNGAWLLASLLADAGARRLLIEEPERATEASLAAAIARCTPLALVPAHAPDALSGLLTRATLESLRIAVAPDAVGVDAQPGPLRFAAWLDGMPMALRTGRGWMVGGLPSQAEILGCGLVIGEVSAEPVDPWPGLVARERLERLAESNAVAAELLATPWHAWDTRGHGLIHGLNFIELLLTRPAHAWELLGSVPVREGPLAGEIRATALRLIDRSTETLGFEPTMLLLEEAEAGRRTLRSEQVARLDRGALLHYFPRHDMPPDPWPGWIELPAALKAELWTRLIASANQGWAELAMRALNDLAPDAARSESALAVMSTAMQEARVAGGDPVEWAPFASLDAYPELRDVLGQWVRENVLRMRGNWQTAYLVLGNDAGGVGLARANVATPIVARLVTAMRDALSTPHADGARAWLEALATSPLRDAVPLRIRLELAASPGGPWTRLELLRQVYEGADVEVMAAPVDERPFLERELEALAQRSPAAPSNLAALAELFGGGMPERAQRAVAKWIREAASPDAPAGPVWLSAIRRRLQVIGPTPEESARGGAADAGDEPARETAAPPEPNPARAPEPASEPTAPAQSKRSWWARFGRTVTPPSVSSAASPPDEPSAASPSDHPSAGRLPEPDPAPVAHDAVAHGDPSPDLEQRLRDWIVGGNADDDARADVAMSGFLEACSAHELAATRLVLEKLSKGMRYRLAGRAASNARLLDAVALAVRGVLLDRIIHDAAHYDLQTFAQHVADRLRRRGAGTPHAADDAVLRFLHGGDAELRADLTRALRAIDPALTTIEAAGNDSATAA
jgi:hypothetical protein